MKVLSVLRPPVYKDTKLRTELKIDPDFLGSFSQPSKTIVCLGVQLVFRTKSFEISRKILDFGIPIIDVTLPEALSYASCHLALSN